MFSKIRPSLIVIVVSCSPSSPISDQCHIRIGNDYCLPKGTAIEVTNISEDSIYGQILRFPNFNGEIGRISIDYHKGTASWACSVADGNVSVRRRNLEANCQDCEPWFKEFPDGFAREIITVDSREPLFQPCYDYFVNQAGDAE